MVKTEPQNLRLYDLEGCLPSYNVKSTIVQCVGTDYVFLYGGFDDMDILDSNVYLLNLKTKTWEVDDKHDGLYREGHLAVYISNGNILVFGGVPYDEFPVPSVTRQRTAPATFRKDSLMMIYNIYDRKWIGPPPFALDNAPSSRSRHACCLSPDHSKLYVSGGLVKSAPLDDLYCYDLTSGSWLGPIRFVSRFDHFITVYGDKLYSFGGLDKDMNHVKDTITFYSFKNHTIGQISIIQKPESSTILGKEDELNLEFDSHSTYNPNDCERLYVDSVINLSIILDISLPSWSATSGGLIISNFDLDDFETQETFNIRNIAMIYNRANKIDVMNYSWKETFVKENGTLYLLGTNFNSTNVVPDTANATADSIPGEDGTTDGMDEMENEEASGIAKLGALFEMKLSDLGIPFRKNISLEKSQIQSSIPLSMDYERFLLSEQFTDFEIVTLADEEDRDKYQESFSITELDPSSIKIVKVHKAILLSRWPHFQRLIAIGMAETVLNKMFIPEPHRWVKGLLYYLYVGTINVDSYVHGPYTILDYLGLSMLANMYELPDLRTLAMHKLFKLFDQLQLSFDAQNDEMISILLKLWRELSFANEIVLRVKVMDMIRRYWATITRSKPFFSLSKDEIVKLCQDSSDEPVPKVKGVNMMATPRSNRASFESIENLSDPQTPIRNTHSPFVIDSPHNQSSFTSLQQLTSVFNDHL